MKTTDYIQELEKEYSDGGFKAQIFGEKRGGALSLVELVLETDGYPIVWSFSKNYFVRIMDDNKFTDDWRRLKVFLKPSFIEGIKAVIKEMKK